MEPLPPCLGSVQWTAPTRAAGRRGQASDKTRRREHLGLRSGFCFSRRASRPSLFQSPGRRSRRLLPLTTRLASALSHSHSLRTLFPLFHGFLHVLMACRNALVYDADKFLFPWRSPPFAFSFLCSMALVFVLVSTCSWLRPSLQSLESVSSSSSCSCTNFTHFLPKFSFFF